MTGLVGPCGKTKFQRQGKHSYQNGQHRERKPIMVLLIMVNIDKAMSICPDPH